MKNNPNTKYVLIGLAVLIWGLIIYKVVSGLSGNDIPIPQHTYRSLTRSNTDTAYTLLADNYADPFFNDLLPVDTITQEPVDSNDAQNHSSMEAVKKEASYPVQQIAVEPAPAIRYNGYIYNPATKKKTALITYNGRSMYVGIADQLDDQTKIIRINAQELVVTVNGRKMIIGVGGS